MRLVILLVLTSGCWWLLVTASLPWRSEEGDDDDEKTTPPHNNNCYGDDDDGDDDVGAGIVFSESAAALSSSSSRSCWEADRPPPLRPWETQRDRDRVDRRLRTHWPSSASSVVSAALLNNNRSNSHNNDSRQFTYGEVTPTGARQLFRAMHMYDDDNNNNTNVLYDLGSGLGRLVAQAVWEGAADRAVGVELDIARHFAAKRAWEEAVASLLVAKAKHIPNYNNNTSTTAAAVAFRNEDLLETDLSDATHIFVSSLCFPPATLLEPLAARFADLVVAPSSSPSSSPPALQVVATLSDLPRLDRDVPQRWRKSEREIQVSWGRARVRVYRYVMHSGGSTST